MQDIYSGMHFLMFFTIGFSHQSFLQDFINLMKKDRRMREYSLNRRMREYSLNVTQLARYTLNMAADFRSRISKFISGVSKDLVKQCRTMISIKEIDLYRLVAHAQQIEVEKIKEKERENKKAKTGSLNFSQQSLDGWNYSHFWKEILSPIPIFFPCQCLS